MAARSVGIPGSPELRAAALKRLSKVSEQLNELADALDVIGLCFESSRWSNPGVDDEEWARYVDEECQTMLEYLA